MTKATYTCDDGYYLDGPGKLTCLANGIYGDVETGKVQNLYSLVHILCDPYTEK